MLGIKTRIRQCCRRLGFDIVGASASPIPTPTLQEPPESFYNTHNALLAQQQIQCAYYGCGKRFLTDGWLNLDVHLAVPTPPAPFVALDLTSAHPFPSNTFQYAFAEDFMEHLSQADSICFLAEALRTLKPNGVLRLSFPGLRGVLRKHYPDGTWLCAAIGKREAYTDWEHLHFYCEESLELVAKHLGFRVVSFESFGHSAHQPLQNLDSRISQQDLNLIAELTK